MRIALIILLSLFLNLGYAQKKESFSNYILKNSVEIKSLDSDDFSDLQFLKNEIKNKKIIFIGEDKHNCEEIAILRYRLIRFLHKELSFKQFVLKVDFLI